MKDQLPVKVGRLECWSSVQPVTGFVSSRAKRISLALIGRGTKVSHAPSALRLVNINRLVFLFCSLMRQRFA